MKQHGRWEMGHWTKVVVTCMVLNMTVFSAGWTESMAQQDPSQGSGTGDETGSVFDLGVIEVVEASDRETRNVSVDTVSEETMKRFDAHTVAEAANLLPGVTLSRVGARNESMVYVRGFDVKHAPIYLDGIPIYVPYDGYPDLGRFTTFNLSEVVVSKGITSVLYGPNTMGGAINLISRSPVKALEIDAGTGFAGPGTDFHAYANFGSNQGKWYFQGGGSYQDTDTFPLSDDFEPSAAEDGDDRENAYRTDWQGNFKIGLTPNEKDEYAVSYINQQAEKGSPPYTGDDPSTSARYWKWPQWDKESIYFNSRTFFGADTYLKTRAFYDIFQNSLFVYDDATYSTMKKKSSFKSWYDDHTYGGSVEVGTYTIPYNTLKLAVHYKRDFHKEHNEGYPYQRFEDENISIGLEDTIDFTKKIYAIAGVSYDYVDTTQAEDLDDNDNVVSFPKGDTDAVNPQMGLFYRLTETGTIHAGVARKTRIPSIKDKFSYRQGTALPNPDLDPEKSINYEIGYQDTFLKGIRFEVTPFYYDTSDFILLTAIPNPDDPTKTINQNRNIGDVDQYGVETAISGKVATWLDAGLNYTYIYVDNKTDDSEITNIPMHKFMAHAQYFSPITGLSLFTSLETNSKRYSSSDGIRVADGYTVMDAKLIYELPMLSGVTLETGVENLFDADYDIDEGFPESGRTFFANLKYRF